MIQSNTHLNLIKTLCKSIASSSVNGFPFCISGSTPIDLILGRIPNDIDIYFPESELPLVRRDLMGYLSSWGITGGLNNLELSVVETTSEYGEFTLRYDITGLYHGINVRLQLISVNSNQFNGLPIDAYPDIRNQTFASVLASSFGISTSRAVLGVTLTGQLAARVGFDIAWVGDDRIGLKRIVISPDAAEKLVAKSLDKYLRYCTQPFEIMKPTASMLHSVVIEPYIKPVIFLYQNILNLGYRYNESRVSDNIPDPSQTKRATSGYVSSVRSEDIARTGSAGSLPQDWTGAWNPSQELQPTGVQGERFVQEVRWTDRSSELINSFVESMARPAPQVPTPRPSDGVQEIF